MADGEYGLRRVGVLHSPLKLRGDAPRQGREGAPDAWIDVDEAVTEGIEGIAVGDEIIVITWLHQAQREVLKVYPRNDETLPLAGVFATRSPRPTQSTWLTPGEGSGNRREAAQSGANRSD